jgi:Flp pilus assembly protein TadD
MLVTLPLVLLLLDYWPLGRAGSRERGTRGPESRPVPAEICDLKSEICNPRPVPRRPPRITWAWLIVEKLPWLALAAVSCVVTYWAQGTAIMPFQHLPLGSRIANALVSYVAYSGQFFYPVGLAVFYPLPQNALPAWKIVGCGLLLAGISLAVLVCRRKCPYLLVGWLWYLGMLVPVIGLVQVGSQAMADRYTYLTQIGLYIALAWGAERVSRDCAYRQRVAAVTSALAVTSLTCCAWQQVSYWKDGEAVWTHTLACTSKNHLAHGALAIVLAEHGRVDEAIAHYRTALRIKPDWELAHYNLGLALAGRGQIDEAIAHYRMAWKIKPDYVEALNNMAWIRATHPDPKFRDGPEAVRLACRVIELSSSNAAALDTLAAAYAEAGRFAEAVRTAREALDLSAQQNQQALAESLQAKLRLYEARTPFRESPSAIQP